MRSASASVTILVITLALGCSSSSSGTSPAATNTPASAMIGAEGGTLTGADGVSLDVPAGALTAPTAITVTPATGLTALPAGVTAAGAAYTFTPDGLVFAKPVTLHIPTTSASAALFVLASGASTWAPVPGAVTTGGFVTAGIMHFSSYEAGGGGAGGPVSQGCADCATSSCGGKVDACSSDATCNACIKTDYSAASCQTSAAWQTLSACACQPSSCGAACGTECGGKGAGGSGAGGSGAGGSGAGGSSVGGGSAAGGSTSAGGPVSPGCQSCAQSACGTQVNACNKDATCGSCVNKDYSAASCKTDAAWTTLSACACAPTACMAACTAECAP